MMIASFRSSLTHRIQQNMSKHDINEVLVPNLNAFPQSLGGRPAVVHTIGVVQVVVPGECEVQRIHHFEAPQMQLLQPLHKDAVIRFHFMRVG